MSGIWSTARREGVVERVSPFLGNLGGNGGLFFRFMSVLQFAN